MEAGCCGFEADYCCPRLRLEAKVPWLLPRRESGGAVECLIWYSLDLVVATLEKSLCNLSTEDMLLVLPDLVLMAWPESQ